MDSKGPWSRFMLDMALGMRMCEKVHEMVSHTIVPHLKHLEGKDYIVIEIGQAGIGLSEGLGRND